MARLWKKGGNGTGENGKFTLIFSHFSPIFLPFPHNFIHFFDISHNAIFGNFSPFPMSPHVPPFPPISPHFPPISPHFAPFFHFPHFSKPLRLGG